MDQDLFLSEVSASSRKVIGSICFLICACLVGASIIKKDVVLLIVLSVVGLPIFLVGISLIFGRAKTGKGIFSPFTLYLIGFLIGIGSIAGALSGQPNLAFALIFSIGCFTLARKRSKQNDRET